MLNLAVPKDFSMPEEFKVVKVDPQQLQCLAKNIFHEASGESILGQAAVAWVVLNRITHGFAKTPCGVIHQSANVTKLDEATGEEIQVKVCQFSWVCAGVADNRGTARYRQAEQIAHAVLSREAFKNDVPKNILFFHNATVKPNWPYRRVAVIGNHAFYSKEKRAV